MESNYDVYIGRGKCPKTGDYSIWGNPFSHKQDTNAKYVVESLSEALEFYKLYVEKNVSLRCRLHELKDKSLGCWCKSKKHPNKMCHGDVLKELVEKYVK